MNWFRNLLPGAGAQLALQAGDPAPEWACGDHNGNPFSSNTLKGQRYLLWFYPAADTPG